MCNSDMPRIHVTMITIYEMTVFRASVYLYIGGISVTCHSMCATVIPVHAITVSRVTGYVSHGVPSVCTLMFSLTSLYVIDGREYTMRCM